MILWTWSSTPLHNTKSIHCWLCPGQKYGVRELSTLPLFLQQPSNFTTLHLYTPFDAHTTCPKECNTRLGIKLEKLTWCSLRHSPLIISGTSDWKATEDNNYALELEQGAGPSVLDGRGAANLVLHNVSWEEWGQEPACSLMWVTLPSLTRSTQLVQKQQQHLWAKTLCSFMSSDKGWSIWSVTLI